MMTTNTLRHSIIFDNQCTLQILQININAKLRYKAKMSHFQRISIILKAILGHKKWNFKKNKQYVSLLFLGYPVKFFIEMNNLDTILVDFFIASLNDRVISCFNVQKLWSNKGTSFILMNKIENQLTLTGIKINARKWRVLFWNLKLYKIENKIIFHWQKTKQKFSLQISN